MAHTMSAKLTHLSTMGRWMRRTRRLLGAYWYTFVSLMRIVGSLFFL